MDETGFRIGVGGRQRVVTRKPQCRCFAPSSTNRDYVTVIECVSAGQHVLSPMVVLPGKNVLEVWVTNTDLPANFSLAVSDSGYANDEISLHWLEHFEHHSALRQQGEYRLLIFDGYGSHLTVEFIQFCDTHKIIPFCLPPHTAHILQPLDVVLFRPDKRKHRSILHEAMHTCCQNFNKVEFLAALTGIREAAFTPSAIASSFRKTGIYPLDSALVIDNLPQNRPATPEPEHDNDSDADDNTLSTPKSAQGLKRAAEELLEEEMPDTFRQPLVPVIKGSVAIATAGDLTTKYLDDRADAQNA